MNPFDTVNSWNLPAFCPAGELPADGAGIQVAFDQMLQRGITPIETMCHLADHMDEVRAAALGG